MHALIWLHAQRGKAPQLHAYRLLTKCALGPTSYTPNPWHDEPEAPGIPQRGSPDCYRRSQCCAPGTIDDAAQPDSRRAGFHNNALYKMAGATRPSCSAACLHNPRLRALPPEELSLFGPNLRLDPIELVQELPNGSPLLWHHCKAAVQESRIGPLGPVEAEIAGDPGQVHELDILQCREHHVSPRHRREGIRLPWIVAGRP
mmetsp:Transcript_97412/g.261790  ORF Transcript_97412/g.261790 Transcript_97412/m.261790 type:complete len:202 (-) Transcript_97412:46-651(-)